MFRNLLKGFSSTTQKRGSSDFSRLFTEASSREQKKIFKEAARRANERQMETYKKALAMTK